MWHVLGVLSGWRAASCIGCGALFATGPRKTQRLESTRALMGLESPAVGGVCLPSSLSLSLSRSRSLCVPHVGACFPVGDGSSTTTAWAGKAAVVVACLCLVEPQAALMSW